MFAADAIVALHFAFVVFVVGGGLLVLRWPRVAWLHLPAALWGALVEFANLPCPLTELEYALSPTDQNDAFVARLLMPLLYPDLIRPGVLTRPVQIALGCVVVALNAGVYGCAFRRHRRATTPPQP